MAAKSGGGGGVGFCCVVIGVGKGHGVGISIQSSVRSGCGLAGFIGLKYLVGGGSILVLLLSFNPEELARFGVMLTLVSC